MRIIIEGVDKSGKSTIIENMKNRFEYGIAIKNMIKPRDNSPEETKRICEIYEDIEIMSQNIDPNHVFILDRYYQSEIVYSILRGNDRLVDPNFKNWVRDMESAIRHNTLLVLLETDAEIVADRFKKCNEDFVKEDQIKMLQERYNKVFEMSTLPKIKLDTTKLGIEKSLELIEKEVQKLR
jgi:thymidylate kinase